MISIRKSVRGTTLVMRTSSLLPQLYSQRRQTVHARLCCPSERLLVRHALFVSFHYPPDASSSGVLRTLKYTRYLADQGWRATVLCPDVTAYDVTDEALMRQVPPAVRIMRTRYWNTKRHLSVG